MKLKLSALLAAAVLAIAGCGGDDDGGSSDSGTEDSSYDITASEFVASTDKETILLDFLADNPECEGAIDDPSGGVDQGFLLDISARATDLDPEAPIGDEILDACTPE
jgi:ABC-type glycerol-3-phosphate transport system substrate-binding protein